MPFLFEFTFTINNINGFYSILVMVFIYRCQANEDIASYYPKNMKLFHINQHIKGLANHEKCWQNFIWYPQ